MRYGIFSDVHSNLEALNAVLGAYKKEKIDELLCIGDIVGYAANPNECASIIKDVVSLAAAGNHDWAAVYKLTEDYFNPAAKEAIIWTRNNLDAESKYYLESLKLTYSNEYFTLVHGTLSEPEEFDYMFEAYTAEKSFRLMQTQICFIGHTHVPCAFMKDKYGLIHFKQDDTINIEPQNKYIINVGSVGQPRDANPKASFCVYDTNNKEVRLKRIVYDAELSRQKIISSGLPKFLGDRLLAGR